MKYTSAVANFTLSPRDSIELKHESNLGLKRQTSKLINAKDSIEIAKESMSRIKVIPDCKMTKQRKRTSSTRSSAKPTSGTLICCDRCSRMKQSVEVLDGILAKRNHEDAEKLRRLSDMGRGLVRISHIEVINVREQNKSQVAFEELPTMFTDNHSEIAKIYRSCNPHDSKGEFKLVYFYPYYTLKGKPPSVIYEFLNNYKR